MKAPFIFMNTDSEYFYIFPDVFFSKSLDRLTPAKLFYYINYTMS